MNPFGQKLRKLRRLRDISQGSLGEMISVSPVTIGRWERGEMKPSVENVRAVAEALGVGLSDLLEPISSTIPVSIVSEPPQPVYQGKVKTDNELLAQIAASLDRIIRLLESEKP